MSNTNIKDLAPRLPNQPETKQKFEFFCVINDHRANERFDAKCILEKTFPITRSRNDKRIALAHVYVYSVADQEWTDRTDLRHITKKSVADAWGAGPSYKAHSHFILFDLDGNGRYVRRDRKGNTIDNQLYSIQELGTSFYEHVSRILRDFAR
jgi:hypothetical protein